MVTVNRLIVCHSLMQITCVFVLEHVTGNSVRYVVLGDSRGQLYVFSPRGDLLADYATGVHLCRIGVLCGRGAD